jgi:hypothetical protein
MGSHFYATPHPPPTPRVGGVLKGVGEVQFLIVNCSFLYIKAFFTQRQGNLFLILFRFYNFSLGTLFNFKYKPQVNLIFTEG